MISSAQIRTFKKSEFCIFFYVWNGMETVDQKHVKLRTNFFWKKKNDLHKSYLFQFPKLDKTLFQCSILWASTFNCNIFQLKILVRISKACISHVGNISWRIFVKFLRFSEAFSFLIDQFQRLHFRVMSKKRGRYNNSKL